MQLIIWESVVGLDQIPFGSQSKSSGRQFGQSEPWGGSSKVGVTGLGSACWPRLLHAIDQEALPGVCCLPDAQRIAASRPFHGAAGDALLALALLLHAPPSPPALPAPPQVVWGLGLGLLGRTGISGAGAATAFPSASGRDTSPNSGLQRPFILCLPAPQ